MMCMLGTDNKSVAQLDNALLQYLFVYSHSTVL